MTPAAPRALIAEDEPLLAAALQQELRAAWPELQIAATVGDGLSAVQQSLALQPDVLFFDVRMPGQTGLDAAVALADAWPAHQPFPALVFVTAYDQYAVQAFETQAIDYVLKPVQPERLHKSAQKLRAALAAQAPAAINPIANQASLQATADQLRHLLAALQPGADAAAPAPLRQLPVSTAGSGGSTIRMVPLAEVLYLQAADKYVRLVTPGGEHLLRTPLKDLLPRLSADEFWQIHRSTLVRADAIDTVRRDEAGKLHLTLRGCPDQLAVSRLYAHLFKAL